jgi:hypothetical protein
MSPMLSFAADFWPLLGAIMGAGALVTVALSLLIATISPAGSLPRRGHRPALAPAELADQPAEQGYPEAA